MPNNEYFQTNPTRLDTSRSRMTMHPRWTGSWNTGVLVPIFASSGIMPGDTVRMDVSAAIRSITPVFPVMDDCDITVEAFFVPHRLVLSRKSMSPDVNDSNHSWAAFLGAQDSLLNMPTPGDVKLPHLSVAEASYTVGGLADCLGCAKPGSGASYNVNALKPLAYYSIWNEFFRDPNTRSPVTYTIGSSNDVQFTGTDAYVSAGAYGNFPLAPVSRYHGYFGSALPWPQRNTQQVEMPLGQFAPVVATSDSVYSVGDDVDSIMGLRYVDAGTNKVIAASTVATTDVLIGTPQNSSTPRAAAVSSGTGAMKLGYGIVPENLWADLSTATAATINQLREKVQEQRWYEALARGGNKLEDLNYSMFGVRGPSVVTRPEYLGGVRIPISISQVASTSDSGSGSAAGSTGKVGGTGAFSLTNMNNYLFTKSFTEHGTLMIVACVRVHDSFGQGISREDTKFDRFEFYWPQFANLGEQTIKMKEIYVTGNAASDNATFGYQEAWAEYRMFPDQVTGYVRPGQSLDMITYANNFASAPTLKSFLTAASQKDNVDRTLQVRSSAAGFQWYGQFQFNITMTRPMPLYSIPGLIDHH